MTAPLLISTGFPKTGSIWLAESLYMHGEAGFCSIGTDEQLAREFIESNPFTFNPSRTREVFAREVEKAREQGLDNGGDRASRCH